MFGVTARSLRLASRQGQAVRFLATKKPAAGAAAAHPPTTPESSAPSAAGNASSPPKPSSVGPATPLAGSVGTPVEDVKTPEVSVPTATAPSLAESTLDDLVPHLPSSSDKFGERTHARAKGASKSSTEAKRANLVYALLAAGAVGTVAGGWYLGREWEDEVEKMKIAGRSEDMVGQQWIEEGGLWAWAGRARLRALDTMDYLNKPAWDPLLPPPLPEPHYRPYTLVLELDDLLVHSSWDTKHGWRTAKRPGVDYFLAYLSQFYEIVLFTTQPAYTAIPIVEKLDPYGAYIPWKLFRDSTRYTRNTLVKDLSYLGRPLNRVVMLDTNPESISLQPENAILLKEWKGKETPERKKELVDLIPFLEALAIKNVPDVRSVIKHYGGEDVAIKYAKAEEESKKALLDKWEREKGSVVWSLLGGLGGKAKDTPPETDVEKIRRRAQASYREEQKYWADNKEMINKQIEEDRARQLKEMKGSLLGMMGIGARLPPPAQA